MCIRDRDMTVPKEHVIEKKKVLSDLKKYQEDDYVAWIGHATFLIKLGQTTIITDPVFSKNAGPLIFGPKRFTEPALRLNEIPKTDVFLLTHNHYDHQDMMTIRRFPFKKVKVLLPLKLGKYFTKNGYEDVNEMDWYDEIKINDNIKKITPKISGGGQEFGLRGGTENLLGIVAFGECAKLIDDIYSENNKLIEYINIFEKSVNGLGAFIFGVNSSRLPNTSLFAFPNVKAETLLMKLDLAGFSVSSGSACSSGKVKESHVLKAMSVDDKIINNAIRISLGWASEKSHIIKLLEFFQNDFNKVVLE